MNWKELYTGMVLKEMDEESSSENINKHLRYWWVNTRNRGKAGLRLSIEGLKAFQTVGIETHRIDYPAEMRMTPQVILFMDKFLDCPYFLEKEAIIVLDSKRAIELTLYSGDIKFYGETKARNQAKKNRARHEVWMKTLTKHTVRTEFFKYHRQQTGGRFTY